VSERVPFEHHEFNVLVRDLDPQGHVANHVYVAYLSEARARFMRAFESGETAFRPSVVAEMRCRYRSPLLAWEMFRVRVRIARVGRTSVGFAYEVRTADRLIAEGDSVEVLVDPESRRPREIPAALRSRLEHLIATYDEREPTSPHSTGERTRQDGISPRS
jgi:acyl-CoA thioester hydrolase